MEDISRELEREIARAKPTPYKTNTKRNVLVVNDFGEMKSGQYLSVLVRFLTVTSLVFGAASAGLYYLYGHQAGKISAVENRLAELEKKNHRLTNEKEILMAQLVMAGDKPVLGEANEGKPLGKPVEPPTKKTVVNKSNTELASRQDLQRQEEKQWDAGLPEPEESVAQAVPSVGEDEEDGVSTGAGVLAHAVAESDGKNAGSIESQVIAVEKFSVSQSSDGEELRVKFNIRNIKEGPGEISGRIFLVLKPEGGGKDEWIVAPKAPLAGNGVPSVYKRGQYFSISRFKPVKFTISSRIPPERIKVTGVFIFNDQGQLIFNDMVETSQDEET